MESKSIAKMTRKRKRESDEKGVKKARHASGSRHVKSERSHQRRLSKCQSDNQETEYNKSGKEFPETALTDHWISDLKSNRKDKYVTDKHLSEAQKKKIHDMVFKPNTKQDKRKTQKRTGSDIARESHEEFMRASLYFECIIMPMTRN